MSIYAGIVIRQSPFLKPGQVVLMQDGKVVWAGALSAPWEDAECDTLVLSRTDYDATVLRTLPDGRKVP